MDILLAEFCIENEIKYLIQSLHSFNLQSFEIQQLCIPLSYLKLIPKLKYLKLSKHI